MERNRILSFIVKIGAAVMVTIASFIILPPTINGENISAVNFYNFFAFFAGVAWLILYREFKNKVYAKKVAAILLLLFVGLVLVYEKLYNEYSISCQGEIRIIVSDHPVKKARALEYEAMKKKGANSPLSALLNNYYCISTDIWDREDLEKRFYTLIALYMLIILVVLFLLNILAGLFVSTPEISPANEK